MSTVRDLACPLLQKKQQLSYAENEIIKTRHVTNISKYFIPINFFYFGILKLIMR